jgi:2-polyprenyl-6-methoxyphenol hydroxylase-like FAD-dependent oxidoreductase
LKLPSSLIVAADGAPSPLRRAVGLDVAPEHKRVGVRTHFRMARGVSPSEWVHAFACKKHELHVTPLPDGELLVTALATPAATLELTHQPRMAIGVFQILKTFPSLFQHIIGVSAATRRLRPGLNHGAPRNVQWALEGTKSAVQAKN